MVVLVALLQTAQDRDGRELIRLIDHYGLESALQGLVLLEILLILIQGGGTDGTELTTGEGWLQNVGGIHRTLTTAGTYQRVDLIDEEDDAAFCLRHLVDDALQALLKLTLILRTCHQRTHIEGIELFVLQVLWHVATYDTTCQTFHDGGLTSTWLTNQDRVVLRMTGEDLQQTTDLIVTPDHRVELTLTRHINKVLGVLLQTLVVVVSRLRLYLLSLAQCLDGLQHLLLRTTGILHDTGCGGVHAEQGEQDRFYAHKLIAHLLGCLLRTHEYIVTIVREIGLTALHLRQMLDLLLCEHLDLLAVHPEFLEDEVRYVLRLLQYTFQYVYRFDDLLTVQLCGVHRLLYSLLCFDCKFVECHILFLLI